jgi:tRNA(adenine34) deaminase
MSNQTDQTPMQMALDLARQAAEAGEVPVGAVIIKDGKIVAKAQNEMKRSGDPTDHAEMQAIRKALIELGTGRLDGCDLYVTLEPCTMCAGAIAHAKLRRVYYGAEDQKGGAVDNGVRFFASPTCHHHPEVISGIGEAEAADLLIQFFAEKRA